MSNNLEAKLRERLSTFSFGGRHIPEDYAGSLIRYVAHGLRPGSFMEAIITNNLRDTLQRDGGQSWQHVPAIVAFLYSHCPAPCWGSIEKMNGWIDTLHKARHNISNRRETSDEQEG